MHLLASTCCTCAVRNATAQLGVFAAPCFNASCTPQACYDVLINAHCLQDAWPSSRSGELQQVRTSQSRSACSQHHTSLSQHMLHLHSPAMNCNTGSSGTSGSDGRPHAALLQRLLRPTSLMRCAHQCPVPAGCLLSLRQAVAQRLPRLATGGPGS